MTSSETNATTAATKIRDTINTWAAAHSDATSLYVATTDGSTINLVKKDAITLSFGTWSGSGFARKATTASGAASNTTRYTASLGNSVAGDTITVVTGGLTVAATVGATDSATLSNLQTALATAAAAASTPITTYSVAATSTAGSFEFTDSGSTNMSASATASGVTATKAITLAASATVSDFATALNALTGVSASIVNKGSGTYSLVVKSSTGVSNALSIASTSGNFTTTAQSSGLASQQIVAASDAAFTVDGVSLTREINVVSDLFDGATITLNSVTAAGSVVSISGTEKVALAQVEITAFVAYINEVRSTLTELTKRGLNGADPGALAGDLTANTIKQKLSRLTTEPIVGFGDTAIYLSDLGVETERDGSLSLDATTFKNSFALDPSKYKAIFQSKIATSISGFTGKTTSYANITPGVYDLTYNSATDAVSIGDVNFITSASTGFDTNYYSTNAAYLGLTLSAGVGDAATAKLYVGKSLKDKVTAYIDKLMATTGDFTTRETKLVSEKTKYETEITDLEAAALVIEARYIEKFTAMEQMVTKFKNTGEYLTTMMDAWVNQK
jgi:flagellar hook-associated protein 2